MTTTEERLSRLEGGYDHLATKADLANVEMRLSERISSLQVEMAELKVQVLLIAQAVIPPPGKAPMGFSSSQEDAT